MRAAALSQFLIDVTRGPLKRDFAASPGDVLAGSPLDGAERAAVRDHDVAAMWTCGVHPMALLYFARSIGWSNERYYGCLESADRAAATTGGPAADAPPEPSSPPRTHPPSAPHVRP